MARRRAKAVGEVQMESAGMMRWLLTYADMITLLLGLFILLFAISRVEEEKFKALMQAIGEAFGKSTIVKRGDGVLEHKRAAIPSIRPFISVREKYEALRRRAEKIIEKEGLKGVEIIEREEKGEEKVVIRIKTGAEGIGHIPLGKKEEQTPLFDLGKATIRPEWKSFLDTIASMIKTTGSRAIVEGHTCDIPINTFQYPSNWELSVGRASSVVRYFIERGVSPNMLSAAGYADTRPIAPNISEENRRKNRRVEIIIALSEKVTEK